MAKPDFSKLLNQQIAKATASKTREADKPAVKWRYLFGFLAWTVLNAIVIALCAGASVLTIKRIK